MKKVILALAIVSVTFAACNDSSKKTETTSDTTTVVTPVAADTSMVVKDTTMKTSIDTIKK
jgi:hypothetical protein